MAEPPVPTEKELRSLIAGDESALVEFKQSWFKLDRPLGKAELAKDVLAMANTVGAGEVGTILFGVIDAKKGGGLQAVEEHPSWEALAQILDEYISPPVVMRYSTAQVDGASIGILQIGYSRFHPHSSRRDHDRVLVAKDFYVRRGPTVATARREEIETFLLERNSRLGVARHDPPLNAGFLGPESFGSNRRVRVRVINLTDAPVLGVRVVLDAHMPIYPFALYRRHSRSGMTLQAGETIEDEFTVSPRDFWCDSGSFKVAEDKIMCQFVDLTLRVYYVGRDGVLERIERDLLLGF